MQIFGKEILLKTHGCNAIYLYNKELKILEIYMRNYANPQYCESSLVFDGEYLRQGFGMDNIIY